MNCKINIKRQEAGRLGGITTFLRYGSDHMYQIGRSGGRPRLPDLAELQRRQAALNDKQRRMATNGSKGGLFRLQYKMGEVA